MNLPLSVIVCAHNPRPDYLARVLTALREQTLDRADWELILVDNASAERLSETCDLRWHPLGRHLREDALGLTPARLCGIRAALGEVLVFVDDDNVLAPDFLAVAQQVANDKPFLGCWGPGIIRPEYEAPLPAEFAPYQTWWCVREIARDAWANFDHERVIPVGAGLCIRRESAQLSAAEIARDENAMKLDRSGASLASGGDIFLCLKCLEHGWSSGLIRDLQIVHLIPPARTTAAYLIRLAEGFAYSDVIMDRILRRTPRRPGRLRRMVDAVRTLTAKPLARRIARARRRGARKALAELGDTAA